jgi:catechol 2,3-dioxygenase-like lactoylglutathione lyase family enzyme
MADLFKTPLGHPASVVGMAPRFECVGLIAADMAKTLEFYRRLGMEFPEGAEAEPHAEAALPGGSRLMVDTQEMVRGIDPHWSPPQGGHAIALAFRCEDPAEVDRLHAELTAAGYRSDGDPFDAFWGQRYATVLDPDGNPVDLFASLSQED